MSIAVCIATCGADRWRDLARRRALPSASGQGADDLVLEHQTDGSVASARNAAAAKANADYLIFLDADDELREGYVSHMRDAIQGEPALYAPRIEFISRHKIHQPPKYFPEVPLTESNWLVIGTMVPRDKFLGAGGFSPWVELYEDWHLFARLWRDGCKTVKVPAAIYRAHVEQGSRNRSPRPASRLYWHQKIGHDVFPDRYLPTTSGEDVSKQLSSTRLRFA